MKTQSAIPTETPSNQPNVSLSDAPSMPLHDMLNRSPSASPSASLSAAPYESTTSFHLKGVVVVYRGVSVSAEPLVC